jgi:MFS superfamily sulfate permease-like transporter
MAYATLAGLDPIYGLYSCFFPAATYMLFGTSRHISIGTFAVVSMMVGAVRVEFLPEGTGPKNHSSLMTDEGASTFTALELMSVLTFGVGLCQLMMAVCRLSFLTNYISDPLVSGFTTGSAVHVLSSQLDKAIGVKLHRHSGPGMILLLWRDLIEALPNANLYTLGITVVGITFLSGGRDYINPWFKRKYKVRAIN